MREKRQPWILGFLLLIFVWTSSCGEPIPVDCATEEECTTENEGGFQTGTVAGIAAGGAAVAVLAGGAISGGGDSSDNGGSSGSGGSSTGSKIPSAYALEGNWFTIKYGIRCDQNGRWIPCYSEVIIFEGNTVRNTYLHTFYGSEDLVTVPVFEALGSFSISSVDSGNGVLLKVDHKLTPTLVDKEFWGSLEVGEEISLQRTYSIVGDNLTVVDTDDNHTGLFSGPEYSQGSPNYCEIQGSCRYKQDISGNERRNQ